MKHPLSKYQSLLFCYHEIYPESQPWFKNYFQRFCVKPSLSYMGAAYNYWQPRLYQNIVCVKVIEGKSEGVEMLNVDTY